MPTDRHATKAAQIWQDMTPTDRAGVLFGLLPFGIILEAGKQGFDEYKLYVELMHCAGEKSKCG